MKVNLNGTMNALENLFRQPQASETLAVSFVQAGGGSVQKDLETHEKTLPWAVFAQSVSGWYEIAVDNGPLLKTRPGGAFLVPANRRMKIIHRTLRGVMEINWIHVQCTVFQSLDLLSFYRLPVILAPVRAAAIAKKVREIRTLEKSAALPGSSRELRKKALAFDVVRLITGLGEPLPMRQGNALERLLPVIQVIQRSLHETLSVAMLAEKAGVSMPRFHTLFKEAFGQSPHRYLMEARIKAAQMKLLSTDRPLADIVLDVGFDDPYHFSRAFKRIAGLSPSLYREQKMTP